MNNLNVATCLKIIFLISAVSLISAYFIEYILGYQPCNLCLIERIPYGLSLILIVLSYISKENERFIILLLSIIFTFSFLISIYHFGIEQGFFQESDVCISKNASEITSKEDLLNQLQQKKVSCKDVTFRILGFSLTTINIVISLIVLIFLIKIFKNYEKFKK